MGTYWGPGLGFNIDVKLPFSLKYVSNLEASNGPNPTTASRPTPEPLVPFLEEAIS